MIASRVQVDRGRPVEALPCGGRGFSCRSGEGCCPLDGPMVSSPTARAPRTSGSLRNSKLRFRHTARMPPGVGDLRVGPVPRASHTPVRCTRRRGGPSGAAVRVRCSPREFPRWTCAAAGGRGPSSACPGRPAGSPSALRLPGVPVYGHRHGGGGTGRRGAGRLHPWARLARGSAADPCPLHGRGRRATAHPHRLRVRARLQRPAAASGTASGPPTTSRGGPRRWRAGGRSRAGGHRPPTPATAPPAGVRAPAGAPEEPGSVPAGPKGPCPPRGPGPTAPVGPRPGKPGPPRCGSCTGRCPNTPAPWWAPTPRTGRASGAAATSTQTATGTTGIRSRAGGGAPTAEPAHPWRAGTVAAPAADPGPCPARPPPGGGLGWFTR
ncbi:hypothetical protein SUDANB121_05774 [Nocardiopsis dassonvillei]